MFLPNASSTIRLMIDPRRRLFFIFFKLKKDLKEKKIGLKIEKFTVQHIYIETEMIIIIDTKK